MHDAVSPELALIDPDLRARLAYEPDPWVARRRAWSAQTAAAEVAPAAVSSRWRVRPTAVLVIAVAVALLAGRQLVGDGVSQENVVGPVAAAPSSTGAPAHVGYRVAKGSAQRRVPRRTERLKRVSPGRAQHPGREKRASAPSSVPARSVKHRASVTTRRPQVRRASVAFERAFIAALPQAARARRVPRAVLDPATALVRTGTIVTCSRIGASLFRCLVTAGGSTAIVLARPQGAGHVVIVNAPRR